MMESTPSQREMLNSPIIIGNDAFISVRRSARLDFGGFLAELKPKKTGYNPPDGYNGFNKSRGKNKQRRY